MREDGRQALAAGCPGRLARWRQPPPARRPGSLWAPDRGPKPPPSGRGVELCPPRAPGELPLLSPLAEIPAARSSGATRAIEASSSRDASRTDGSLRRSGWFLLVAAHQVSHVRRHDRFLAVRDSGGAPGLCRELATQAPYGLIGITSDQLARVKLQPDLALALRSAAAGQSRPQRDGQRGAVRGGRPDQVTHGGIGARRSADSRRRQPDQARRCAQAATPRREARGHRRRRPVRAAIRTVGREPQLPALGEFPLRVRGRIPPDQRLDTAAGLGPPDDHLAARRYRA